MREPGGRPGGRVVNEPLVSVLIPVYNHARYVGQCLDSLLNEGWSNLEVLVLDDGSSDDSYEVVRRWRENHSWAFSRFESLQQSNQGLPRTLNRLIGMARGEYLTLLASDDYLLPGGIAARIRALEMHPHWLAAFGDCIVVDPQGIQLKNSGLTQIHPKSVRLMALSCPELLPLELILRWSIPGPVLLLRAEAYKKLGLYDESLRVEDRDFYLRLLAQRALGFVNFPVAAYRIHPFQTSGQQPKLQLEDLARSARKNISRFEGLNRYALYVDYRRLSSSDWKNRGFTYKVQALAWRMVWRGLDLIQNSRLLMHLARGAFR